jgi:hypothetical protein
MHLSSPSGAQITVSGQPRGGEILVSAKIKMNESCYSGLLILEGQAGKQQVVSTAFVTTSDEDPMTLTAQVGSFSRDLSHDTLGGIFVPFEPPEPATTGMRSQMRDRRALLAVNENSQGGLDMKLYLDEHQNCEACPHQIGSIASADMLESWCEEKLAEVSTIVGRDGNFNAHLRSIGVGLASRVLTEAGRNILETYLSNIDTLVISSQRHNIPWEWLTLPQRSQSENPPSPLGDALRTIRFSNDPTLALMHLKLLDYRRPSVPLLTVGINTGAKWHYGGAIESAEDLQRICQHKPTVHLVGHAQNDWIEFPTKPDGSFRTRVNVDDFGAYRLWDTNNVVISACQIASAKQSHNLAVAVSTKCRCIVWAPLVKIDIKHAQAIDEMLGEYLGSGSIEEFMKDKRDDCPLLRLYVRYGLGTAPS